MKMSPGRHQGLNIKLRVSTFTAAATTGQKKDAHTLCKAEASVTCSLCQPPRAGKHLGTDSDLVTIHVLCH